MRNTPEQLIQHELNERSVYSVYSCAAGRVTHIVEIVPDNRRKGLGGFFDRLFKRPTLIARIRPVGQRIESLTGRPY